MNASAGTARSERQPGRQGDFRDAGSGPGGLGSFQILDRRSMFDEAVATDPDMTGSWPRAPRVTRGMGRVLGESSLSRCVIAADNFEGYQGQRPWL